MMRCPAKRKKTGGPLPARGEPAMCGPALPGRKSRSTARVLPACLLGAAVLVASAHAADHAPVADMVRELRLPPFDAPPEFSLYDVWLQYRWQAVASLIAAGLILLLGLRLLIGNRKLETAHRTVLRQKQQLEESEQRYRFLFSNNPLPMFVLAEDGLGFLEVNERAIEHYGFTREEFGRMTLYDIRTVEGVAELERAISSSPGSKILVEARHKKKSGAVIDVAINAMPLKYGEIPAWIALVQDITGRRALQRRMANQLLFIKAIINAEVNALAVCHDIDEPPYTRFTVWNPSMEALTGYRMDEINRLGWYQTVYTDPEIQEQARQRMERMRRGDHLRGEEWVITRKDGSLRVVQVYTVTVIGDERGTHTLAVMQDITERKQAERELRTLSTAIEQSPLSVVITGLDAAIQYANPCFLETTGYSLEEAIGQNPRILQSGVTPRETYAELWKALTSGQVWRGELVNKRKNGELYWEEAHIAPVKDSAGVSMLYVAVKLEITQRKQAEEARRLAETQFRTVFDNASDAIVIHDVQGRFLEVNRAMCERLGYSREELLRLSPADIDAPDAAEKFVGRGEEMMAKGQMSFEAVHVARDGREIPVEINARLIEYAGQPATLSIVRDITGRKQAEAELKRSNVELEHFGYAISHDMRQPLRMISSYLQLIEMELADRLDAEKRSYFDFAIEGAKRIDQMLVALLEYSRAGRMGEAPTWIDSRAALDEALLFLQPAIAGAQARLDIAGDWPRIFANRDEIVRLMQNLIGNAVKFRAAGQTPEIAVTGRKGKNEWHLCVADNGIGIIPDQTQRLFQVFQRLQLRTAYEGNGVGLALCRKIAEHHKGRIWAESAGEGRGSRFHVVLPVPREEK